MALSGLDKLLLGEFKTEPGALSRTEAKRAKIEVYIVNKDRLIVTDSKFIKDAAESMVVDTVPMKECLNSNKEFSGLYRNYRGVEVVGTSICIPSLKWTLLVEANYSEVFKPMSVMLVDALETSLIVAGLLGVLYVVFYGTVAVQLRRLSNFSAEIARGNYDVKIPFIQSVITSHTCVAPRLVIAAY